MRDGLLNPPSSSARAHWPTGSRGPARDYVPLWQNLSLLKGERHWRALERELEVQASHNGARAGMHLTGVVIYPALARPN